LAEEVAPEAPGLAAAVLLEAAPPLVRAARVSELAPVAEEARRLAEAAGDPALLRRAVVCGGAAGVPAGRPDAWPELERYHEMLDLDGASAVGVFLAEVVAPVLAVFRWEEGDRLLARLADELGARSAAPALIAILGARAVAVQRRDLRQAVAHATAAMDLAAVIGRPALARVPAQSLVVAAGLAGDRDACLRAHDLLRGAPALEEVGLIGRGTLHLTLGELPEALEQYERLVDEHGPGSGLTRWEADWCEALVRSGRRQEARAALDVAASVATAWMATGSLDRVRGLLAEDPDEAEAHFGASVAWLQGVGNQVGEARTELCWGEWCRRARRRGAARRHLAAAEELFEGLHATVWAERARAEAVLAGAGGPVGAGEDLTPREAEIARRAADGASNQEIGEALFLSPRTVETHLSAVYRKLGVRNRRQLAALAASSPHRLTTRGSPD